VNIELPRKVKVVPYNPDWPKAFITEAAAIKAVLGDLVVGIYHMGSTSIPGATAKPIIDIMPVVTDINFVDDLNGCLAGIGYVAMCEYGIPDRRFFTKNSSAERTHHLHIYQTGHPEIARHLSFRDYMRSHPAELIAYGGLKTELARQHPDDIEAYTNDKSTFIKEIDRKAAVWRSSHQSSLPPAILLLGPTGSGKTPLGELLESEGLPGRRCYHFDFGSRLRRYATHPNGLLSTAELNTIAISLRTGSLLTDDQFPIAEKLLAAFIGENGIGDADLLVLNGLPRHAGQAAALEKMVTMKAVIVLECGADTVMERVRTDAGGDRDGRIDDTTEDVTRKLALFAEKTLPLIGYYEGRGVTIARVEIGPCCRAEDTRNVVSDQLGWILA
jgi:adenylate kinase